MRRYGPYEVDRYWRDREVDKELKRIRKSWQECKGSVANPCKEVPLGTTWTKSPFIEEKEEKKKVSDKIPIQVKFYSEYRNKYQGREYSYFCKRADASDISLGGLVVVPAGADNRPTVVKVVGKANDPDGKASKDIISEFFDADLFEDPGTFGFSLYVDLYKLGVDEILYEGEKYHLTDDIPDDIMAEIEKEMAEENNTMKNFENNMMSKMFAKVDNVVMDMMTGKTGIKRNDSIFTANLSGDVPEYEENMFTELGMPLPAFAQAVALTEVKRGDIVVDNNNKAKGWVLEVDDTAEKVSVFSTGGVTSKFKPAINTMLGGKRIMVVKNLLGDNSALGGLQGMLMPYLMMNGGKADDSVEKMMQMVMFQNSGMFGGAMSQGDNSSMQMMMSMMMMKNLF